MTMNVSDMANINQTFTLIGESPVLIDHQTFGWSENPYSTENSGDPLLTKRLLPVSRPHDLIDWQSVRIEHIHFYRCVFRDINFTLHLARRITFTDCQFFGDCVLGDGVINEMFGQNIWDISPN